MQPCSFYKHNTAHGEYRWPPWYDDIIISYQQKEVIQEIQFAIAKYSSKINDKEKEDDLRHDAVTAEVKVKDWKVLIMRAHNQEESKQKILLSLQRDEVFTQAE